MAAYKGPDCFDDNPHKEGFKPPVDQFKVLDNGNLLRAMAFAFTAGNAIGRIGAFYRNKAGIHHILPYSLIPPHNK